MKRTPVPYDQYDFLPAARNNRERKQRLQDDWSMRDAEKDMGFDPMQNATKVASTAPVEPMPAEEEMPSPMRNVASRIRSKSQAKAQVAEAAGVPPKAVNDANLLGAQEKLVTGPAAVLPTEGESKDEGMQKRIAMAILGLAPALVGAVVGGNRGGAAGGEIGAKAVSGLINDEEKERLRKIDAADKDKKFQAERSDRATDVKLKETGLSLEKQRNESEAEYKRRMAAVAEREAAIKARGDKAPKAPTADQLKAATFARRVQQAEAIFDDLTKNGFSRAETGQRFEGMLPGEAMSSQRQSHNQAEQNFVNAVLRRESGAAISPTEFATAEAQYFPRPGDSAEVVAQKKANRLQSMEGLRAEAGSGLDAVTFIQPPPVAGGSSPAGLSSAIAGPNNPEEIASAARQARIAVLREKQKGK